MVLVVIRLIFKLVGIVSMSEEWLKMTACDLGRDIEKSIIDPLDLTEVYLKAVSKNQFKNRIYARLTEERALREAEEASTRARTKSRKGLLDGVPISWKDLFDTGGVITEAGTGLLKNRVPNKDAWVLKNATVAGLVCLGKTHMSELAFSGLGQNPMTETPPCVNDHDAVPGGSSSGSAASVAFNIAAASIGSDTGGSVRIPAAWNDLVGLKTTIGRLSVSGTVPLCPSFDTVGPLCRSVEDAAYLLGALEGKKVEKLKAISLRNVKVMVLETVALENVRPEVLSGFNQSINLLKEAGASIEFREISEITEMMSLTATLFPSEAYATWKTELEASPELMFPEILERFMLGSGVLASDYIRGWKRLNEIRFIWLNKTKEFDVVALPTSPILPPNAQRLISDSDYYKTENLMSLRNTRIGNLLGLAALTLPTYQPSVGLMLMSEPHSEEKLLAVGSEIERLLS